MNFVSCKNRNFQAKEANSEAEESPPNLTEEAPPQELNAILDKEDEEAFDCSICDYRAINGNDLNQHIVDDHKDKVAVGSDEDHDHAQDVAVKFEKEKDPGKMTPQLSIDENKQANRSSLDTAEKMLNYSCNKCDFSSARVDSLKRHLKNIHGNTNVPSNGEKRSPEVKSSRKVGKFACDQCSFVSARADNLRRHNSTQHNIDRLKYECMCGVVYLKKENLHSHKMKCSG